MKSTLNDHNKPPATSDTTVDTITTDQSNNQLDNEADDVFTVVAAFVESLDCNPSGDDELDEILWEMVLAVWAYT
jgi:hypothetical protein